MRIKFECSYNGTNFHGWAKQKGERTVEGEVSKALQILLRTDSFQMRAAGRTDAGVHAKAQIFHLDLERLQGEFLDLPYLVSRLNGLLPEDVSIKGADCAHDGFDARFSALSRTYVYRISPKRMARSIFLNDFVWDVNFEPDLDFLNFLASYIPGLKDFASFALPNPGGTTIRDVKSAVWAVEEDGLESGIIKFKIQSDAFARKMVRFLVGAQICAQRKKKPVEWFSKKFQTSKDFPPLAPPKGLTLEKIEYPPDGQLAERARLTKAVRDRSELGG